MKTSILSRGVKGACFGAALAGLAVATAMPAAAQAVASDQLHLNVSGATVPTTKILAIGRWTPKATTAGVRQLLPTEVRDTVRLYLDGVIDQWFIQQDNSGVVFLLNVTDTRITDPPVGQLGFRMVSTLPAPTR
jgi:hypothetical protein